MRHVGIIGYGKMGRIRAETFDALPDFEVTRVFDVHYDQAPDKPTAASIDEMVADPDLDVLVISLPNYLVKDTTIAALRAGKHVFCEKPPAMTGADLAEIQEVHTASNRTLMYGFNHRRHGGVMKMKELVDGGTLGRVLWMRGRYGKSVDAEYLTGWRADKDKAGGGILLDQGIHMLDLFLHIAGRPFDEVQAMVSSLYWQTPGIEDNVFAMMRNSETGVVAQLHSTMTQWRHLFSLEVFLSRGYMVLNGLKTGSGSYGEEVLTVAQNRTIAPAATWEQEETFKFEVDTSWETEAAEFRDAVNDPERQGHGTVAHARQVMELIDRIYAHDTHVGHELYDDLQGRD